MTENVSSSADDERFASELIAALQKTHTLDKRATVIYRCQTRNCVLMYVFVTRGLHVVHQPRYKLSNEVNQRESADTARARHTLDGDRRWKEETFLLRQADGQLSLQCDHCRAKVQVDSIASDVAAATRQPTEIKLANNAVR
jgi:hypothetical protein